jgi:hypothetical protein
MADSQHLYTFQDTAWPETEHVFPYVRAEANRTDQSQTVWTFPQRNDIYSAKEKKHNISVRKQSLPTLMKNNAILFNFSFSNPTSTLT